MQSSCTSPVDNELLSAEQRERIQRLKIMILVFAAIMLNYIDRQVIALLKPMLQSHFGWTNLSYSYMTMAYQLAAAFAFLGSGWLIDRVGLKRGFALGVGVWSAAGMLQAAASTVAGFMGSLGVLGAAEAIGTPAQVKTAATYFPVKDRSMMIGIGNMASNCGAIVAPLVIVPLALWLGWRAPFLIAGGLGYVWILFWLRVRHPREVEDASADREASPISWLAMIGDRRQWAVIVAKCFSDNVWWFLLFFIPDLLHRSFGLPEHALAMRVSAAYVLAALGSLYGGWLPSVLLRRGWSVNRSRKTSLLVFALLITIVPLALLFHTSWVAAAILGVALFAHQGFSTNVFGMSADLFPAQVVGTAVGIGAFAGNLSGMVMLWAAGWSLDHGHGYAPLLFVCAGSYLVAFLLLNLFVPRIESSGKSSFYSQAIVH